MRKIKRDGDDITRSSHKSRKGCNGGVEITDSLASGLLEGREATVERQVIRSVVIVVEEGGSDYCSGFVAKVDGKHTYILTQSPFVNGRENRLRVCFWDKGEQQASVIDATSCDPFCLLRTDSRRGCQAIRLSNDDIQLSRTLMFPPSSPTSYFRIPSFVTAESLPTYSHDTTDLFPGSASYFLLTCHYGACTSDGHYRLVAAPVYNMSGYFVGAIIDNCLNYKRTEMDVLGTEMDRIGSEMKVAVSAKVIPGLLDFLLPKLAKIEGRKRRMGGVDSSKESGKAAGKGRFKGLHTSK